MTTFTTREFRDALGLFPTGVAVITTTAADGERIGATVSSFNSVSLDPPLVLFSIGRTARAFAVWDSADRYAVSILEEEQSHLSNRFARSMGDKWSDITPDIGDDGTLLIPGALARFSCERYASYDGGDHIILVGRVLTFSLLPRAHPRPLLFYRGRYRQLDTEHLIDTPPGMDHLLHGW